jgi:ADP-ribose pyrophosphatase YjhB (NUDIX family)
MSCYLVIRNKSLQKVALNEAIELAKNYGGENTGRFVNGVLGAIYKEMGEPGKDQVSKKKKFDNTVDLASIPVEDKGGAIIFSRDENGVIRFAMVHDVFGYWTLSKGGMELGENPEEGTVREIKEEIGLDITIIEKLGENEYVAHHPEKGKIRKHVHYFLAEGLRMYHLCLQLEQEDLIKQNGSNYQKLQN